MSNRVVVVEDSHALNDLLCGALRQAGYQVDGFLDSESLSEHAEIKDADILVLDVQLPGESGLELSKRLRSLMPRLGILMLTSRSSNANRIEGYDAGADYYLPKPVSSEELVRAVDSLVRRKQQPAPTNTGSVPVSYMLSSSSYVLSQGERWLRLSHAECVILAGLASARGEQLEHWQIIDLLSSDGELMSRSTLDVRVYRLRTKLSEFTGEKQPIASVRGFGYRLGFALEIV